MSTMTPTIGTDRSFLQDYWDGLRYHEREKRDLAHSERVINVSQMVWAALTGRPGLVYDESRARASTFKALGMEHWL